MVDELAEGGGSRSKSGADEDLNFDLSESRILTRR